MIRHLQFWRIRAFGMRDWWDYLNREGFAIQIAWLLPRKVALWAFIRVYAYGTSGAPGPDYNQIYDAWVNNK